MMDISTTKWSPEPRPSVKDTLKQIIPAEAVKADRLFFIDNIRWLMIIFVIMVHAGVTYSGLGSWYYKESAGADVASVVILGLYQAYTQSYFMGLLFLLAGYFVPSAFDRKGSGKFLVDRAVRLGIPTLIYVFIINISIKYFMLPWSAPRPPLSEFMGTYLLSLKFLSQTGPMWFALALLIFSAIYALIRAFQDSPERPQRDGRLPGSPAVAGLVLLLFICTFSIRLVMPIGTSIMNMQPCFFSQYILLFIMGIAAYRNNWLSRIPYSLGMTWFKITLIGGFVFLMAIMALGDGISGRLDKYYGGLYWQSAALALWESFTCIGICLGVIVFFRERFNTRGKFAEFMADNCFSVYLFHAPILILISLILADLKLYTLLKFLLVSAITVPVAFLVSHLILRRVPLLKRVL